jgi:hypothetical protein
MRKQLGDESLAFSKMNFNSLSNNLGFGPHDIAVNNFFAAAL